jgi:hypothetical protein
MSSPRGVNVAAVVVGAWRCPEALSGPERS